MSCYTFDNGIKFFEPSMCLAKDGASATASTGSASADYILTNDTVAKWESVEWMIVTGKQIT